MASQIRNVFISHKHGDDEALRDLKELLERHGIGWRDYSGAIDDPNHAYDEDYIKHYILAPRIRETGCLVVYVAGDARQSDWADWEIDYARQHGKRTVGVRVAGGPDRDFLNEIGRRLDAVVDWSGWKVISAITDKTSDVVGEQVPTKGIWQDRSPESRIYLDEYQQQSSSTDRQPVYEPVDPNAPSMLVPLLGMVGELGEFLSEYKKWLRDGDAYQLFPERAKEELGDLLWYLSNTATKFGLSLEDVARYNLDKTANRWAPQQEKVKCRRLLDEDFPLTERLPRQMDVTINEGGSNKVRMFIAGKQVGDDLRDNRYEDDGYRFHDVFHLTYASVLGWSPILRALLRRKRRSNPAVDEVEDGGRARVIEEGIAAMVFSYAERRNFLEGAEGVNYELLRTIKDMTSHLEVSCRTAGDWERAILEGFQLWRKVRTLGQANLHADLELGTIELVIPSTEVDGPSSL